MLEDWGIGRGLVDHGDVERRVRVDGHEECAGIPCEVQDGAGWDGGEVRRWWWRGHVQLGQDDDWQLCRARDDEHLRERVGEWCGERGVKRGREGGAAETCAEVGVVASFNREDGGSGGEEDGVVGKRSSSAEVGANTNRGDHVGKVDEGGRVGVREGVGAVRGWGDAILFQDR